MTRMINRLRSRTRRRSLSTTKQWPPAAPIVVTRAELAECTCPDACERDHEQD